MNGGQLTGILIVAIVMIAIVLKARYQNRSGPDQISPEEHAENRRLREEVKELQERLKVLERITVEKENSLSREIEELRDR